MYGGLNMYHILAWINIYIFIGNGVYAVDSRLRNGVFILGSQLNL